MAADVVSRTSRRSALAAVVAVAVVVLLMPIISVVAVAEIAQVGQTAQSAQGATRPTTQPLAKPSSMVGSGGERSENAQSVQAAAITQLFSTFRAKDIEGRELTASSLRGRIVVLDFWATWCAPCLKEVPTYQRLRRDYDASRLEIIGVSVDMLDHRGLVSWLNRQQVTWTTIHDRRGYSGELAQQFKVMSLPTTYVFDADGRMVAANVRGERLIQTVAELLSSPSAAR